MIPRSQHIFKILQLAVSLVIDLGLDDHPKATLAGRTDAYVGGRDRRSVSKGSLAIADDAARASLGCFYLASVYVSLRWVVPRLMC
jgi:hypothetical protein